MEISWIVQIQQENRQKYFLRLDRQTLPRQRFGTQTRRDSALRKGVLVAIDKFLDKNAVDDAMKQNLIDNFEDFHVVDHARRYKLGV